MLQFLILLLVSIPAALLVAGVAGQFIARRGLQPLEDMASRAEGITASSLHDRLQIDNPDDELGQMARAFNHLLERLDQTFGQMKRFTADAAHELRAPLAAIRTMSEVALEKKQSDHECREALANILEETARLNETIDGLLLLARAEASQPGQDRSIFPARELVNEVLSVLSVLIEEKQISIVQDSDLTGEPMRIYADRPLLRIAFMNVLHNAVKFSPRRSTLRIVWACGKEKVRITVRDQGPGITPGEEEKVFDRFFTSHSSATASGSGTGLGLSIAKLIVIRAGGRIWFEPAQSGASCVLAIPTFTESLASQ